MVLVNSKMQLSENSESPIRVMQIIARMNVGGPAILVADLIRGLNDDLFQSRLISGYCGENEIDYLESVAKDIPVIRVRGLGRKISLFSDLRALFTLIKEIKEFKPHIVHTHTVKAGVLGRVASLLSGHKSRRIHTFHGHLLFGYFNKSFVRIIVLIEKILALKTDLLLAVGSQVKKDLVKIGVAPSDKFIVTLPGLKPFKTNEKSKIRKELNIKNQLVVALVGRLTEIKRPDRFIGSAMKILEARSDVIFLVVGDGELRPKLVADSKIYSDNFVFLGWRNDVEDVISLCDVVALTSDNEGIPLSLIQACQAGKPVVATNAGSVSDLITDGVNGYLTEFSVEDFTLKLLDLLENPQKRLDFGKAGIAITSTGFSRLVMQKQHREIYSHQFRSAG
jgi:glycosyltransferase involved in cell wall biosynthesis